MDADSPAQGPLLIRNYYDTNASSLNEIWAGHLHHGLWRPGQEHFTKAQAGAALVDLLAEVAGLPSDARILDLGCGSGGTCIQLCLRSPGVTCVGVNFSGQQIELARTAAVAAGVSDRALFLCADACTLPIDVAEGAGHPRLVPHSFDSVWMLESLSQMDDRAVVLGTAARLLKPGGSIVVSDWMRGTARSLSPNESAGLISTLERSLGLVMEDEAGLRALLNEAGFNAGTVTSDTTRSADPPPTLPYWEDITPFCLRTWAWAWGDLLKPAFWWLAIRQLPSILTGIKVKSAMDRGLETGAFRVGVLVAARP